MRENTVKLFVYGTLMPSESNYHQVEDHVSVAKPGTIEEILVDLGAYPALIPGHGIVKGVVLRMIERRWRSPTGSKVITQNKIVVSMCGRKWQYDSRAGRKPSHGRTFLRTPLA